MDLLLPLFQLLYFIIHFLYSLAEAVYDCFTQLYHGVCYTFFFKRFYERTVEELSADCSNLKKLPTHLAFILMPRHVGAFAKASLAVRWGRDCGIEYFSFYDPRGVLKENISSCVKSLTQILPDICIQLFVDGHSLVIPSRSGGSRSVTINLFSDEDGQSNIAEVAKDFAVSNKKIDFDAVSDLLLTKHQPDPDLALILGHPLSTCGFLPWQVRLTEFICFSSVAHLNYSQFQSALHTFSRCEQRFGT